MHGKGTFTWKDGRKYIGDYKDDKKEGYGEFYWPNGLVYKGQWQDGKQHGEGKMYRTDNPDEVLESKWANGQKITE